MRPEISWDVAAYDLGEQRRENKLQGIHIEQNQKKQNHGQKRGVVVFQAIAAGESVMRSPDQYQLGKAGGKRKKDAQGGHQIRIAVGNFQRNHQQRDGETEDDIAESFQPGDLAAAPTKVFFNHNPG